jgi:4-hydroxy-3-polyprenylbenzoate decarboxylase
MYAIRLLEIARSLPNLETHVVISPGARETISVETEWKPKDVEQLSYGRLPPQRRRGSDLSGSFPINAMIVRPRSMGSGDDWWLSRARLHCTSATSD